MGAATKSSSAESKRTTAGRNLPPGVWRKSIRIRMTSPGRSVMNQQFVDRIFVRVGRLKLLPARNTPGYISFGGAPLEHHLNLRPRGTCDAISGGTAIWPFGASSPLKSAVFISDPSRISSHAFGQLCSHSLRPRSFPQQTAVLLDRPPQRVGRFTAK